MMAILASANNDCSSQPSRFTNLLNHRGFEQHLSILDCYTYTPHFFKFAPVIPNSPSQSHTLLNTGSLLWAFLLDDSL